MTQDNKDEMLDARSPRFISLSGWSGIWVGVTALIGAYIAYRWLQKPGYDEVGVTLHATTEHFDKFTNNIIYLGIAIFVVAIGGALFFTRRKAQRMGRHTWNNASRLLVAQLFYPVFAGGVFCLLFIYYGSGMFVVPACLVFYGLALISAARHTISDIRYLGMLEVALGCTAMFFPGYGLIFWAIGFGVLHVFYGAIMRGKYDK